MFLTNDRSEIPPPFPGDGDRAWPTVELAMRSAFYMATTVDRANILPRTFLLHNLRQVEVLAEGKVTGRLKMLGLVLAPRSPSDPGWRLVHIERVDREIASTTPGKPPNLFAVDRDGVRYSGYPVEISSRDSSEFKSVFKLGP